MSVYVKPAAAFKKLDAAKLLKQNVYIYGATGYGKTELIRQYFKKESYIYIPCSRNSCDLSLIPEKAERNTVIVIDNVNFIESSDIQNEIKQLCSRKYVLMELGILRSIILFRTGEEWKNVFARRYPLYLKHRTRAVPELQPMDIRILSCPADGLSIQKTAEKLSINYETLRSRITEIYRKMGAQNKTEAVMIAREANLI